jgi:hypothetical protein
MIVAYSRGDGAATNYEIAWVTVALQHLRAGDDSWARIDPVHRWLQTYGPAGAARARGGAHVPARLRRLAVREPCASQHRAGRNATTFRLCSAKARETAKEAHHQPSVLRGQGMQSRT